MKDNWHLNHPERRNYQRLNAKINVHLIMEGKQMEATTANISCGGMFLPIQEGSLHEHNDVEVILNIPDEHKPVKVIGEVSRLQVSPIMKGRRRGVAIEFRGLYDDNRLVIDRFVKDKLH